MNIKGRNERLAYCKNGDAVSELQSIISNPEQNIKGGPFVYVASFLYWGNEQHKLIISRKNRNAVFRNTTTTGRVFNQQPIFGIKLLSLLTDITVFIKTFFYLALFRPTKMLCAPSGAPLWASYLAARLYSARFVHTRHAIVEKPTGSLRGLATYITHKVILRADAVICHGPYLEKQLLELGVNPDRLYPFNLSYDYLEALQLENNSSEENPLVPPGKYIFFAGRMTVNKGIIDLMHAAKSSLEKDRNLYLVYAGDGPDCEPLKNSARELSLENQVILLGQVQHNQLPVLIKKATVVALPTQSMFGESRCKSAIESLVLGKPVIAPDFGPFPYIIKHEVNGLLFKPDSTSDLENMITRALADDKLLHKMSAGATESGKDLLKSEFTFMDALDAAFYPKEQADQ